MKKSQMKRVIKIKKIISLLLVITLFSTFCGCGSKNALKIMAGDGQLFATVKSDRAVRKNPDKAYLEIVVAQAVQILADINKINADEAKNLLYKGGYTVYTALERDVNENLAKALSEKDKETEVAATVTDMDANIIAVYSTKKGKENFATTTYKPCSSFKPLSVYAPAIDSGVINWSSRYEDSPYKYVKNLEGVMRPWPANSSEYYSERYVYIYQAIKESLNTAAVKCLADYGVDKSIEFLETNFNIPVSAEKLASKAKGADEVIGNIALGLLTNGVNTVDMAGYYQIFANGGKYEAPKAVLKICDAKGKTVYERKHEPKQVIKTTTAEIMNQLLKEVVTKGGTGEKAKCEKVEVAGKTGTDDGGKTNWFVGVTPEYSIALWHGASVKNDAAEYFGDAVNKIYENKTNFKRKFPYKASLTRVAYCTESGKKFKAGCSFIRTGYYTRDNVPGLCDRH